MKKHYQHIRKNYPQIMYLTNLNKPIFKKRII